MRQFTAISLIALFAGFTTWFFPWWMIAIVSFVVTVIMQLWPRKAFWAGAAGIGLLWTVIILVKDIPNAHILSGRMAKLFSLPGWFLFILVNILFGGLIGGLAGWSGGLMNRAFRRARDVEPDNRTPF